MRKTRKEPRRPYPEGTTPSDVARAMGFIPPHQRPEVQKRMRERARREAEQEEGTPPAGLEPATSR